VFADVFTAFGEALGPCLDGFGAEVLVVGGSIARSWDVVADPIRAGMRRHAAALDAVTVTRAAHLADAPLLGAAFAASVDARA
jgi:glucokinase